MKKFCSVLLVFCLVLTLFGAAAGSARALSFTDLPKNHWAYQYITYLSEKNVLSGDGNGKFRPDDTVTRCEFIKMIDATFGLHDTTTVSFTKMPNWGVPYIRAAAAQGYLLNYNKDVNFDAKLTREEAVALLMRYLGFEAAADFDTKTIADYSKISDQYKAYVSASVENNIVSGYTDSTFKPQRTLTRAEALTVLYRAAGAIYSVSTQTAETGCNDENAVINDSVSLTGLTLKGNVYVTEGAELAAFNNCTIKGTLYIRGKTTVSLYKTSAERIVVQGESTVNLTSGSSAGRVDAYAKTALNVNEDCRVTTFIAYDGSRDSSIKGKGSLTNLGVYVNGVVSDLVPNEYYAAKGCTVTIGGKVYEAGSGKPVTTGFTAADIRRLDARNEIDIRISSQANGIVYACTWLKTSVNPTVEDAIKNPAVYLAVTEGTDAQLRIPVKYYGFEYNVMLIFVGEEGAAIPLYNNGVITGSYESMTTAVPVPTTFTEPGFDLNFNVGSIVLSFDRAMYLKNGDGVITGTIEDGSFMTVSKSVNGIMRTLSPDEYVMEVLVENERHIVCIYPNEGIEEGCEYTVMMSENVCDVHGSALLGTSRTAVAAAKDAGVIVPEILPDSGYVSNGSHIDISRPLGAAGLRYVYTINGGVSSLPATVYGDTSISIDDLGTNAVITVKAEAISNSGEVIGKSAAASYIVNVAPILTIAGKTYTGTGYSTELSSSVMVSANAPAGLYGENIKLELYVNDHLQASQSSLVSIAVGVIRAVLYDGNTVIGTTSVTVGPQD